MIQINRISDYNYLVEIAAATAVGLVVAVAAVLSVAAVAIVAELAATAVVLVGSLKLFNLFSQINRFNRIFNYIYLVGLVVVEYWPAAADVAVVVVAELGTSIVALPRTWARCPVCVQETKSEKSQAPFMGPRERQTQACRRCIG